MWAKIGSRATPQGARERREVNNSPEHRLPLGGRPTPATTTATTPTATATAHEACVGPV